MYKHHEVSVICFGSKGKKAVKQETLSIPTDTLMEI